MKLEKNFILSGISHTQKGEYSIYLLICEVNNNQTMIHRHTDGRYRVRDQGTVGANQEIKIEKIVMNRWK